MTTNILILSAPATCDKCSRKVPAGEEVFGVVLRKAVLVFCGVCAYAEEFPPEEFWGLGGASRIASPSTATLARLVAQVRPDLALDGPPLKPALEDLALAEELRKLADGDLEAEPVLDVEAEVLPLLELDRDAGVDALRADVMVGLVGGEL